MRGHKPSLPIICDVLNDCLAWFYDCCTILDVCGFGKVCHSGPLPARIAWLSRLILAIVRCYIAATFARRTTHHLDFLVLNDACRSIAVKLLSNLYERDCVVSSRVASIVRCPFARAWSGQARNTLRPPLLLQAIT